MRIFCFLFLLIFAGNTDIFGQDKITGPEIQESLNRLGTPGNSMLRTFNNAYQGVRGSPYLFSQWGKGIITLTDGKTIQTDFLKYNAHDDELVIRGKKPTEAFVINKLMVGNFEIYDSLNTCRLTFTKVLMQVPYSRERKVKFMEVLWDGKNGLYIDHSKVFMKADYQGAYNANRPYDEFRDETSYYLRINTNAAVQFRPGQKDFLRNFPDNKEVLDSIFKEKPDFRNRSVLVTIMEQLERDK